MPNGSAQSGKTPDPPVSTIEYGHTVLLRHAFYGNDPSGIGPGSFIRLGRLPFQVMLVSENDSKYIGIALDRPSPLKLEEPEASTVPTPRDYAGTLGPEYFASLDLADAGLGVAPATGVGTWGTYARVPDRMTRIGVEKADRCWDLSNVLSRLLVRFHANPKHKKTGYLANSEADTGIYWKDDLTTLLRCIAPPRNALQVIGGSGVVYSSHFRHPNHPCDGKGTPQGWSGALTLVGQIGCIAGVLADRLAELVAAARHDATIVAIDCLVGRQSHPISWNNDERENLARVRSELLRAKQWTAVPVAHSNTIRVEQRSQRSDTMTIDSQQRSDDERDAASMEQEFELGRRRLLEYQSRAQDLAHRNAALAKMMRESTSPFMDLVIRHAKAEASHRKALGRWHDHGSGLDKVAQGHDVPNPESIDRGELKQFAERDYRTICLFRIGRLASTGLVQSLLADPVRQDDPAEHVLVRIAWDVLGGLTSDDQPMLDPRRFPPKLAKQMVEYVEKLGGPAVRGQSPGGTKGRMNAIKSRDSGDRRANSTQSENGYRPATWFPKGMAARLRMAAQESRKTKRVATLLIDGVMCYSIEDARRWWPRDVPKET
jgi:hypothetical protein